MADLSSHSETHRHRVAGSPPERHPHAGFTLLELLVVLAIIGLIAAVATPNFRLPGFASDAAQAAREIASELGRARQRAIFANRPVDLVFDVDRFTMRSGAREEREISGIRRLEVVTTAGGRRAAAEGAIRFYPDGSSEGGEVTITGESRKSARIRVNWLTGRIEIDE